VEKGLRHWSPRPKESFYLILLAISQQEGNYQRLADLLEFWSSNPQPRRIIGRSSLVSIEPCGAGERRNEGA